MKRLAAAHEHLDGPLTDEDVLAGNLRDLRRLNRFLGGVSLSRHAIDALVLEQHLPDEPPMRLIDVGTGGADIPLALLEAWGKRGRRLSVTAVDSRPEVLGAASVLHPAIANEADLRLEVADGRQLPFADGAFDVAHASLVLHHLEPGDAALLVREMSRVGRKGVVINDLSRGWLTWLGAWLILHLITRNRFTLDDGPLSVRRAYTIAEARQLVAQAGLRVVHQEVGFAGHRWAIAAVAEDRQPEGEAGVRESGVAASPTRGLPS
ncbi:MAG TPA: methyltransferase domain-containing protein [Candidatus Eisenbacteria bacterium]|nr:methyltransferase domain-containing protein [Candidatus Eisenbacteria bacterium]